MTNSAVSEAEFRAAIRRHPKMWVDPLYSEIGGVACIANMIDALLWGDYFEKPNEMLFTIHNYSVEIVVNPGSFLLSGPINGSPFITSDAQKNIESIVDWVRNNFRESERSDLKSSKFNAIIGVVYLATSFVWEFDSILGHFKQEYLDGTPASPPLIEEVVRGIIPTSYFSFSLKNGFFKINKIHEKSIELILSEFSKNNAIPSDTQYSLNVETPDRITLKFLNKN